ncbi:MAG: pirin family protein [Acidobacteriia bacterium]|jgi:redox-sensitive bicupin YhaK (pirin superfamily)|nr:pirin family protein [Terriglobia bacterium]
MITIRRGNERGRTRLDWLDSYHTFSFDTYYDPHWMQFRSLRVLNEDVVAPGRGFGMHPHRNMEILTYLLAGALAHRDSLGNGSVIRPGEIQRMTAGTGIAHSEFNASDSEPVHLLQIWIFPERKDLTPGYEQRRLDRDAMRGRLLRIAGPPGESAAVTIHQDAHLYAAWLEAGQQVTHTFAPDRHGWLQVARGQLECNGHSLEAGDGAAFSTETQITLKAVTPAEILLFDLA